MYAGGAQIVGTSRVPLVPKNNGYYSRATFSNISIFPGMSFNTYSSVVFVA